MRADGSVSVLPGRPRPARRCERLLLCRHCRPPKCGHDAQSQSIARSIGQRLDQIPGIGPALGTALFASVPDPRAIRSGRYLSAWIGLRFNQHSSGGKDRLGSISKQDDHYLRSLFTTGALADIRYAPCWRCPNVQFTCVRRTPRVPGETNGQTAPLARPCALQLFGSRHAFTTQAPYRWISGCRTFFNAWLASGGTVR